MGEQTEISHNEQGIAKRELTEELVKEIKGQKKKGEFIRKYGLPWWQWLYPHEDLVRVGIEEAIDSKTLPTYSALMPNGKEWGGIPSKATPKLKAILYSVQSLRLLPTEKKPENWLKRCEKADDDYGHMITTQVANLMLLGLDKTPGQQEARILEMREELFDKGGPDIKPLLEKASFYLKTE